MGIRRMLLYFFPYERPITRFSRHIARDISNQSATRDEIILIERGHARNKEEARRLMTKYNASHALDVIKSLPCRRRSTFRDRLQAVGMQIEGTSRHNPHDEKPRGNGLDYRVKYRE